MRKVLGRRFGFLWSSIVSALPLSRLSPFWISFPVPKPPECQSQALPTLSRLEGVFSEMSPPHLSTFQSAQWFPIVSACDLLVFSAECKALAVLVTSVTPLVGLLQTVVLGQ